MGWGPAGKARHRRGGAYSSTGRRSAHPRAAAARASPGPSPTAPSAAPAMPRDTLTSSPPPGRPAADTAVAGPSRRTGSMAPPWAPTPGTRKARPGATARIPPHLVRRRGSNDQADGPPREPQPLARRAAAGKERLVRPIGGVATARPGPGAHRPRGSMSGTGRRRSGRNARGAARSPRSRDTGWRSPRRLPAGRTGRRPGGRRSTRCHRVWRPPRTARPPGPALGSARAPRSRPARTPRKRRGSV